MGFYHKVSTTARKVIHKYFRPSFDPDSLASPFSFGALLGALLEYWCGPAAMAFMADHPLQLAPARTLPLRVGCHRTPLPVVRAVRRWSSGEKVLASAGGLSTVCTGHAGTAQDGSSHPGRASRARSRSPVAVSGLLGRQHYSPAWFGHVTNSRDQLQVSTAVFLSTALGRGMALPSQTAYATT